MPVLSESEENLAGKDALQWDVRNGLVPNQAGRVYLSALRGKDADDYNIELNGIVKTVEVSQHETQRS